MTTSEDLKAHGQYWVFTDYKLDRKYECVNLSRNEPAIVTYLIHGLETCPTTGRLHRQGYLELDKEVRGRALLENFRGMHFKKRKGTAQQAADYCRKDNNDIVEFGTMSKPQPGRRTDLAGIREAIMVDGVQVRELAVNGSIVNYQQLRFAQELSKYGPRQRTWEMDVRWYWGDTGAGKSRLAWEEASYDPNVTWCSNKDLQWWDGYSGQENVILDDFRGNHCPMSQLLKILDRYPLQVAVKGSFAPLLAKVIWITSPYHPRDVYTGDRCTENIAQLLRRITLIKEFRNEPVKDPYRLDQDIGRLPDDEKWQLAEALKVARIAIDTKIDASDTGSIAN